MKKGRQDRIAETLTYSFSRRNTRTGPISLTIMLKDKNESYNIVVRRLHLLSILTFKTGRILICLLIHLSFHLSDEVVSLG